MFVCLNILYKIKASNDDAINPRFEAKAGQGSAWTNFNTYNCRLILPAPLPHSIVREFATEHSNKLHGSSGRACDPTNYNAQQCSGKTCTYCYGVARHALLAPLRATASLLINTQLFSIFNARMRLATAIQKYLIWLCFPYQRACIKCIPGDSIGNSVYKRFNYFSISITLTA